MEKIRPTIDSITSELQQMNNSCKNLGIYGEVIHKTYNEQINIVKEQYFGKKQINKLEKTYLSLKEYESMLIPIIKKDYNANEHPANYIIKDEVFDDLIEKVEDLKSTK